MIENSIHLQMKNKSQSPLDFQNLVARTLFLPLYFLVYFWMRWIKGYRIENLNSIRLDFEKYLAGDNRPILICANHLTLIDSMLIAWGLGNAKTYLKNFRFFGWNLPEKDNFYHNYCLRTLCYLAKCIPVRRKGTLQEAEAVSTKIQYLINKGESIVIFPEGGRTRTGTVDTENHSYAVGKIIQSSRNLRILCVYIRGYSQRHYSDFPENNELFFVKIEPLILKSIPTGLRGMREISKTIVQKLSDMEKECPVNREPHWK